MKFEIKNRWTGNVQFTAEIDCDESVVSSVKIGLAVKWGLANGGDLNGGDLRGCDLRGVDLSEAGLRGVDLNGVDLRGACLIDADLHGAFLRGASLNGAELIDASLRGSDMRGASLRGADLRGADLREADLRGAGLSEADLIGQHSIKKLPVSDPRGYSWIARAEDGEWIVYAGCRCFPVEHAREHWLSDDYDGPEDVKSTVGSALDWLEKQPAPVASEQSDKAA